MAKTTFKHTLPDGNVVSRKSERAYTHIIIGRRKLDLDRAVIRSAQQVKTHKSNYEYHKAVVATEIGQTPPGYFSPVYEQSKARAIAEIEGFENADAYAAAKVEEKLAKVGDGEFGPWTALQWSMSAANALKALGKWDHYSEVSVQPVTA